MNRLFIALAAILVACLLLAVLIGLDLFAPRLALAVTVVVIGLPVLFVLFRERLWRVPLLAVGLLALAACSTATTSQLLTNLSSDCERHYDGTIGASMAGGQFQGTVKIDCTPKGGPATPAATAPAPGSAAAPQ